MITKIITYLLDKLIGKYVDNFTSNNVRTGLFQGDIRLENLPLKKGVLKDLTDCPITVKSGLIGRVTLRIPYTKLRTQAWAIMLENIYIVAGPGFRQQISSEKEMENEVTVKKMVLDSLEAKWRKIINHHTDSTKVGDNTWLSSVASLGYKVLRNIQIEVRNVHIRYEDDETIPSQIFALGLVVDEFSTKSSDFEWNSENELKADINMVQKFLDLKKIRVYLDPCCDGACENICADNIKNVLDQKLVQIPDGSYVMQPISIHGTMKRHLTPLPIYDQPRILLHLQMQHLELSLTQEQYKTSIVLLNEFDRYDRLKQHIGNRPLEPISESPRKWWQFAIKEHMSNICKGDALSKRARDLVLYVQSYEHHLLEKNNDGISFYDTLDGELEIDIIIELREIAMERAKRRSKEILNGSVENQPVRQTGWWGYLWGTKTKEIPSPVSSPIASSETSQILEKIFPEDTRDGVLDQDISDILNEIDHDATNFFTKDKIFLRGQFSLSGIRVQLLKDINKPILGVQANNLNVAFESRPTYGSWSVKVALKSLLMQDMSGDENDAEESPFIDVVSCVNTCNTGHRDIFMLAFEKNPLPLTSALGIKKRLAVTSEPLTIIHCPRLINNVKQYFESIRSNKNIRAVAQKHIRDAKIRTRASLKEMIEKEVAIDKWHILLKINAPKLVLPDYNKLEDGNFNCVVLDLGLLQVSNCDEKNMETLLYGTERKRNPDDSDDDDFVTPRTSPFGSMDDLSFDVDKSEEIRVEPVVDNVYEEYAVVLDNVMVLIGCWSELKTIIARRSVNKRCDIMLMEPFTLQSNLRRKYVRDSVRKNPNVVVETKIQRLLINVSDHKVSMVKGCLNSLTSGIVVASENVKEKPLRYQKGYSQVFDASIWEVTDDRQLLSATFILHALIIQMESDNRPLAELTLTEAQFNMIKYRSKTCIDLQLLSLIMADARANLGPNLDFIVASHKGAHIDPVAESSDREDPLIAMSYEVTRRRDTRMVCHRASVAFSGLDIIANQETIMELVSFAKHIVADDSHNQSTKDEDTVRKEEMEYLDLSVACRSVSVLLINIGMESDIETLSANRIGTISLVDMKVNMVVNDKMLSSAITIRRISIHDLSTPDSLHTVILSLTTGTSEINTLTSVTDDPIKIVIKKESISPHYTVTGTMPHFIYVHSPQFIDSVEHCVTEFQIYLTRFKNNLTAAARNAILSSQKDSTNDLQLFKRYHFHLQMLSPILVLPRHKTSKDVIIIHLGDIDVSNDDLVMCVVFTDATVIARELPISKYQSYDIVICTDTDNGFTILNKNDLRLRIVKITSSGDSSFCGIDINAEFASSLAISLSKNVYEQVLNSLDNIVFEEEEERLVSVVEELSVTEDNIEELAIRFRTSWSELKVELYPDTFVVCNDPMLRLTLREISLEFVRQNKFIKDIVVEIQYLSLYQILDSAQHKVYQPLLYSTYPQYPCHDINKDISNSCPDLTMSGDFFSGQVVVSTSLPKETNITITPPTKRKRSRSNSDDIFNNSTVNAKSPHCATDGIMERFVQIKVKLVDKKIPDFRSTFNSVNRFIDANFTDLTCRITTDIWVILLDFFGLGSKFFDPDDIKQLTDVTKVLPSFNRRYDGEIEEIINKKLAVRMKQFDLQLENEVQFPNYENLAGVTVTNLILNVDSMDGNLDLSGSVEHFQLDDLSPTGAVYPSRLFPASNEQRLLEFKVFKFGLPDPSLLRDEDMCVNVMIHSPIVYIHTQRFLQEINQFVQNFFQYQDRLSHIRVTSAGRSVDKMAPRSSRIRMKVSCQAPLLLIPVSAFSDFILVADLGRFSLRNAFKFPNTDPAQCLLDEMCIDLHDMDVYSAIRITSQPLTTDIVLRKVTFRPITPKPLSHKVNLHLTVCRNLDSNISHSSPDWLLHGTLSSVVCNLNVEQYRTIRGVLAHNFGENTDHLNIHRFQAFQTDPSLHTDLTGVVWLGMRLELCLNDVQVNLLSPIISSEDSHSNILCRMNYLQSKLLYDSYSDGSKIVELACHDIILEDLRYQSYPVNERPSVFPIMLSRDNEIIDDQVQASYQLKIQYTSSKEKNKFHILLNNMKVITIFDWIKATRTWIFTPPYEIISLSIEHENKFDEFAILYVKSMPDLKSMPLHPLAVREHYREIVKEEFKSTNITCDVKESRFFILEKANLSHTNALILTVAGSCAYDTREYRLGIFSFDIPRLHLASCSMTSSSSNLLSIVNPVKIHVVTEEKCIVSKTQPSLDNVLLDNNGPKLAVNVSVSAFKVRLSFCDLQLLATILRSLPSQTTPPANVAHQTGSIRHKWSSVSVSESTDNQSSNRPLQMLAKFIENVSFTHLNSNDFISVCLIDDCIDADVPLFDIKLNNLIINWRLGIIHEATMQTFLSMDYYNINSFGWTPIIEPWPLKFSWKFSNVVELQLKSEKILNIDVSSHLLQIARNTHKKWSEELATGNFDLEKIKRDRSPFVPFVIVNQLGCPFRYTKLAIDKPPSYDEAVNIEEDMKHDSLWHTVSDSVPQTLCFDRETTARDKIRYDRYGMHFNSSHRIELIIDGCYKCHPITVDKLGVFYRDLVTKDSSGWMYDRVRIVVEIVRQGSVQNKIIIRSSLQLYNALNIPLQVRLHDNLLEPSYSVDVAPNSKLPIPLPCVYHQIQVRPISSSTKSSTIPNCLFNSLNEFSDYLASWQLVTNNTKMDKEILCLSPKNLFYQGKTSTAVFLICTIERLGFPMCAHSLPGHIITITAPLTIENMLPFDIKFDNSLETSDEGVSKVTNCGIVPASQSCTVLISSLCHTTQLSIELDNFQRCKKLTIPGNSKLSHVVLMCLYDSEDRMLELQVKVESRPSGPVHITVFASYWIVNRTSLSLVYAQAGNLNHHAAGQTSENEKASSSMPFPFSFSNNDTYQLVIRLGNKSKSSNGESLRPNWSPKLSLDKLGTATIQLKAALPDVNRPHVQYNIGLEIRPGKGRHRATTMVILTSRYLLDNRSSYTLNITQYNCVNKGQQDVSITALPKSMLSFHWPRDDFDPLLSVRLLDNAKTVISHWSGGFRIDQTSSFHIYLRGIKDQVPIQLRVTVTLEGARFRVVFTDTDDLPPPYLLENLTRLQLFFSQIVSENNNPKYTVLAPNTKVPYALDEPTLPANVTLSLEGGSHATYNLNTIGPSSSLHYENFLYLVVPSADHIDNCQLVFDVQPQNKRIFLNCKKPGSRSQLWYYSSRHELFHEGSSAPHDPKEKFDRSSENHYLLDVDLIAPTQPKNNQQKYQMKLAKADHRREKFQQWYFTEDGCLTNKLGMKCRVVTVCQNAAVFSTFVPIDRTYQLLVMQDWLRPGSGTVNVSILTNGPTRVLRIYDSEESHKYSKNQTSVAKNECAQSWRLDVMVKLKEVGVFLINHLPEELLYFVCSDIEVEWTRQLLCDCLKMDIRAIQCDNQLMDTGFPCVIYQDTSQPSRDLLTRSAFSLSYKRELGHPYDVHVFNVIQVALVPLNIILEEKLLLKVIQMLSPQSIVAQSDVEDFSNLHHYSNLYEGKKIYIGKQVVLTGTMCLSVITADSLQSDLKQIKKLIPYLMSFANAQIPIEPYNREHVFETSSLIFEGLVNHYRNQLRSQAIKIFGSVDFLGNPIGFISDITSGMKRFYSDQNVSGMIKHFAHGIGDSTAKICNSASRVVYGITLDPDYQERRQILLDEARVSTSNTAHVKAGFRSFLNGIVGGAVSVPLQSWKGYKDDGSTGLFAGALKGIVGVVTKPVGGILDFATGSAASFREMARSSREGQPQRRYEPRCLSSSWKLLPFYSNYSNNLRHAVVLSDLTKAQALLAKFHRQSTTQENVVGLLPIQKAKDSQIRVLVSDSFVHVINTIVNESSRIKYYQLCQLATPPVSIDTRQRLKSVPNDSSVYIKFNYAAPSSVLCSNTSSIDLPPSPTKTVGGATFKCDSVHVAKQVIKLVCEAHCDYLERQMTLITAA